MYIITSNDYVCSCVCVCDLPLVQVKLCQCDSNKSTFICAIANPVCVVNAALGTTHSDSKRRERKKREQIDHVIPFEGYLIRTVRLLRFFSTISPQIEPLFSTFFCCCLFFSFLHLVFCCQHRCMPSLLPVVALISRVSFYISLNLTVYLYPFHMLVSYHFRKNSTMRNYQETKLEINQRKCIVIENQGM